MKECALDDCTNKFKPTTHNHKFCSKKCVSKSNSLKMLKRYHKKGNTQLSVQEIREQEDEKIRFVNKFLLAKPVYLTQD